ncbi:MAG: FxLYD domain-containing protein [Nitrososphaera sp.]|uniref:FxLYD domain-containing protein n=1 Tax=Nitrososphaera sp. TaxID=1971748 RepID=UPI00316B96E7
MRLAAWPALLALLAAFPSAYAQPSDIELLNSDYAFIDAEGMTNVVGVVNNKGVEPISVVMALDLSDGTTLLEEPYAKVMFPDRGAPFKFRVPAGLQADGKPYVASVERVDQPLYDELVFNYSNMAVGEERALSGTVTNAGQFPFYNVTVFASVHDDQMVQIDSSRSAAIPVLEPGQTAEFSMVPDDSIKEETMYYSCAGYDPNAPIPTIPAGDGKYIGYNMQTISKVSSLRYDNATDSLLFGIKPYIPSGGSLSLKFAQAQQNQTIAVFMDDQLRDDAVVTMDGRTVSLEVFIPPGDHQVQVQGIRAIPEFPFAALGLAAMTAAAIAAARLRAALKIP